MVLFRVYEDHYALSRALLALSFSLIEQHHVLSLATEIYKLKGILYPGIYLKLITM